MELFNYTKDLIALRKSIEAFKYTSKEEIEDRLKFIQDLDESLVAYILDETYLVIINANVNPMWVCGDILEKYFVNKNEEKIVKIFDKEGINNISVEVAEGLSFEPLSVNVYYIGETYGL